jgi:hypothetical protein
MHETKSSRGRALISACGLLAIPILYIPFRLVAQKYNIATTAGLDAAGNVHHLDNFAYPFSILIWPTFSFLCGSLAPYIAKRLGASWLFAIGMIISAFVLTYLIPWIDEPLGIPGGGLDGFVSWPSNRAGMSTPKLSAILCLVLFWAGASVSVVVGSALYRKAKRNA